MLDFDPVTLLRRRLEGDRRSPDGKLHPSGDLCGSLRHVQLRAAGAPTLETLGVQSDIVSDTRLRIGTLVHEDFERIFRGHPVMTEVKLDRWLPAGWSGTADWIAWNDERKAFVLGDLKTIKPEGMNWINRDGIKKEHQHQLSAYFWALVRMGVPLINGYCVLYLPTGQTGPRDGDVSPSLQEGTPLSQEYIEGLMSTRRKQVDAYLESLVDPGVKDLRGDDGWITDALAPVQEREQKLTLAKTLKRPVINLSHVPNWSVAYCPFPNELCNCREQGATKVGHWDRDENGHMFYVPRADIDQPDDPIQPDTRLIKELVAAQKAKEAA